MLFASIILWLSSPQLYHHDAASCEGDLIVVGIVCQQQCQYESQTKLRIQKQG